jgi:hypothetical protein
MTLALALAASTTISSRGLSMSMSADFAGACSCAVVETLLKRLASGLAEAAVVEGPGEGVLS